MKTEIAKVGSDVELTESESDFFDHFQEITWERRPDIIFDRALNKFAVDRGVHYINFRKHGFWTQPVYLDTGLDNFSAHSSTHIARINCALLYTFGKYTFTFTHLEATATFDVLAGGGRDLQQFASYVLDGFDQGGHDILVNYSRFYSLAITYPEVPFVEEFTELVDLAKISYPEQDRYSVDVILDGELIENESGESSIEGFEPEISAGSEIAIRVRYKDPDNPYFGKIPLILTYRTGVQLALPVEVVKSV